MDRERTSRQESLTENVGADGTCNDEGRQRHGEDG